MKRTMAQRIKRSAAAALAAIIFISSELPAYGAMVPREMDNSAAEEEREREEFTHPEPNIYEEETETVSGNEMTEEESVPEFPEQEDIAREEPLLLAPDLTGEVIPYAEEWEEPIEVGMYYKTYQNPDGSFRTVHTTAPNLYRDGEGEEHPIDNTLVLEGAPAPEPAALSMADERLDGGTTEGREPADAAAPGGVYVNTANSMRVELPAVMLPEEGRGLTIEEDGIRLTMLPEEGDYSRAVAEENAVRYNQVFDNVDIQYTVQDTGVKEDIILLECRTSNCG